MRAGLAQARTAAVQVLLVLPRADHLRAYRPLVRALAGDPGVATVVVTSPGLSSAADPAGPRYVECPFYADQRNSGGAARWLSLVIRRERIARQLLRKMAPPAVVVVPSDVSDAMLSFVEAAARHGLPVVYVQGAVVFADYPELNARMYAERLDAAPWWRAGAVRAARAALRLCGIHVTLENKGVLGSRSTRALLMSDQQVDVHLAAGVDAARIRVTGAPFVDDLVMFREHFDDTARQRLRTDLDLPDGPMALFVSKTKERLGSREVHRKVVGDTVDAIRRELPEWTCVVKLHPNEEIADYEWLVASGDPRIRVVQDHPVEELLLLSDLTLSLGTSSPAFMATLLRRPLILVNFTGAEMLDAHGEFVATASSARSAAELADILRRVAREPAALATLQVAAIVEDAWADGRACERILANLREVAVAGAPAAP